MASFSEQNRANMHDAVKGISRILQPVATAIGGEMPAFEGFALFVQDPYHEDSAGAITQVNAPLPCFKWRSQEVRTKRPSTYLT